MNTAVLWLFYLMSSSAGILTIILFKHIRFTSCFHLVFLTRSKTKVSQLTFLYCCFVSVLLDIRSIAALQFHAFCNSFLNTEYKLLYSTYWHSWVMGSAHLFQPKFNKNLSMGNLSMRHGTQNARHNSMSFNWDLDFESAWLSNRFCTPSHCGKHLSKVYWKSVQG